MPEKNTEEKEAPLELDEPLILKARQGDTGALGAIYDAYARRIYRYLYSRVENAAEAEDLTGQTFLKMIEALPRYQHRGQFTAWIFQIARNHAMDYFRRRRSLTLEEPHPGQLAQDSTLDKVIDDQAVELLHARIGALDENDRELLRLRFVADLTYVQMAGLLGRKEDAVRKAVQRVIERLTVQMEMKNA